MPVDPKDLIRRIERAYAEASESIGETSEADIKEQEKFMDAMDELMPDICRVIGHTELVPDMCNMRHHDYCMRCGMNRDEIDKEPGE